MSANKFQDKPATTANFIYQTFSPLLPLFPRGPVQGYLDPKKHGIRGEAKARNPTPLIHPLMPLVAERENIQKAQMQYTPNPLSPGKYPLCRHVAPGILLHVARIPARSRLLPHQQKPPMPVQFTISDHSLQERSIPRPFYIVSPSPPKA